MLSYFIRKLGKLLLLATVSSGISALLALSLFSMISQTKGGASLPYSPLYYGAVWGIWLLMTIGTSTLLSRLSADAVFQIRVSLIRRILGTAYDKLEQAGSSRLYNVLISDVTSISNAFSELPTFIFNLILLVSCLSYLAYLSPMLFGVLAVAIGISFVVSRTLIGKLARRSREMRDSQDAMMDGYKGMLEGSAQLAVDAARKQHYYEHDLQRRAEQLRKHERGFRMMWDLNRGVTVALVFLLLGVVTEAGRRLGDQGLVMSYALIITYCAGPFGMVMNLLQQFAHARVSLSKIDSLQIDADKSLAAPVASAPAWSTIQFSQIEFTYRQEGAEAPFVLGPLDLEIRKGEVIFITGGNGSGKSTFIKLLLGLHEPSAGSIYIDGVKQSWADKEGYRALFSMVLSDFYLFGQVLDGSGKAAADAQVVSLLERFKMASVVKVLGGVFDTVRLSQGQRKRLALVSAISRERDIYVLDEWAADQDPQYRRTFYEEIIPWLQQSGRTVVAVTHDDRYFPIADRRVDFEAGRIRLESNRFPSRTGQTVATPDYATVSA